jgi:hypothetical protein
MIGQIVAGVTVAGGTRLRAFRLIEQRYEPGDPELSSLFYLRRVRLMESYRQEIETMLRQA